MINIGIIGIGVMGAGHARFIAEFIGGARVVALSDVDTVKLSSLANELGTIKLQTQSAKKLMNSALVDAVIIASPDPLHVEHLRLAIACKKPILCEKPIATDLKSAREIAQEIISYEANIGKKVIHFGFMRRFDPAYRKVRTLIESRDYGKPLFVRTITRNVSSTGATNTGLYTNIAIHDFDVFRWLFNDEWVSVVSHYPKASSLSPENLADPLVITAHMRSGLMMVADIVAFNNYGYDVRTEVVCEKGSIEIGIFGDVITRANHIAGVHQGGAMDENWIPRFKSAYIDELRAWVETISNGIPNGDLATVEDALAANEVCELGVASIRV